MTARDRFPSSPELVPGLLCSLPVRLQPRVLMSRLRNLPCLFPPVLRYHLDVSFHLSSLFAAEVLAPFIGCHASEDKHSDGPVRGARGIAYSDDQTIGCARYKVGSPRRTNLKPPIPAPEAIPAMNPCRAHGVLATFAKSSVLIMDTASESVGLELVGVAPFSPPAVASSCSMGFDQTCSVFSPGLGCPSS